MDDNGKSEDSSPGSSPRSSTAIRERLQALVGELQSIKGNLLSGPGPVTSDGTDDDEIPQNSLSRNNSPPMGNSGPNFAALDNIGRLLQIANGEASPKDTPVRLTSMSTAVRDSSAVMQQPQQHDDRMSRALRYSNRQAENLAQLKLAAGPQTQQLPNEPTSPKHFHNANHDLTIQLESGLATNVRKTTAEGRLAADSQTALADVTQLQQDIDRLRKRSRSLATKVAAARKDDEKVTAELARAASKHAACVAATKDVEDLVAAALQTSPAELEVALTAIDREILAAELRIQNKQQSMKAVQSKLDMVTQMVRNPFTQHRTAQTREHSPAREKVIGSHTSESKMAEDPAAEDEGPDAFTALAMAAAEGMHGGGSRVDQVHTQLPQSKPRSATFNSKPRPNPGRPTAQTAPGPRGKNRKPRIGHDPGPNTVSLNVERNAISGAPHEPSEDDIIAAATAALEAAAQRQQPQMRGRFRTGRPTQLKLLNNTLPKKKGGLSLPSVARGSPHSTSPSRRPLRTNAAAAVTATGGTASRKLPSLLPRGHERNPKKHKMGKGPLQRGRKSPVKGKASSVVAQRQAERQRREQLKAEQELKKRMLRDQKREQQRRAEFKRQRKAERQQRAGPASKGTKKSSRSKKQPSSTMLKSGDYEEHVRRQRENSSATAAEQSQGSDSPADARLQKLRQRHALLQNRITAAAEATVGGPRVPISPVGQPTQHQPSPFQRKGSKKSTARIGKKRDLKKSGPSRKHGTAKLLASTRKSKSPTKRVQKAKHNRNGTTLDSGLPSLKAHSKTGMSAAESPAAAAAAAARKVAFLVASNATSTEIAAAAAAASAAAEVAAAAATAAKRGTPSSVASPNTLSKTADRRDTNEPVTKFYSMDQLKLRHVEALEQIQKLHANLQRCVEAQQYAEAGRLQSTFENSKRSHLEFLEQQLASAVSSQHYALAGQCQQLLREARAGVASGHAQSQGNSENTTEKRNNREDKAFEDAQRMSVQRQQPTNARTYSVGHDDDEEVEGAEEDYDDEAESDADYSDSDDDDNNDDDDGFVGGGFRLLDGASFGAGPASFTADKLGSLSEELEQLMTFKVGKEAAHPPPSSHI